MFSADVSGIRPAEDGDGGPALRVELMLKWQPFGSPAGAEAHRKVGGIGSQVVQTDDPRQPCFHPQLAFLTIEKVAIPQADFQSLLEGGVAALTLEEID